jgi:hypothetical protein
VGLVEVHWLVVAVLAVSEQALVCLLRLARITQSQSVLVVMGHRQHQLKVQAVLILYLAQ